jgi:hypothetical protein
MTPSCCQSTERVTASMIATITTVTKRPAGQIMSQSLTIVPLDHCSNAGAVHLMLPFAPWPEVTQGHVHGSDLVDHDSCDWLQSLSPSSRHTAGTATPTHSPDSTSLSCRLRSSTPGSVDSTWRPPYELVLQHPSQRRIPDQTHIHGIRGTSMQPLPPGLCDESPRPDPVRPPSR